MNYDQPETDYNDGAIGKMLRAPENSRSKLPLNEQEKIIAGISMVVEQLATKLAPVLAPEYPTEANRLDPSTAVSASPLAETLGSNNRTLNQINRHLTALIDRLEC